jgi:transcriptional antiterminator RfaH
VNSLKLPPDSSQFWYALFTKPHQEDRAVSNLSAWGVQSLAPKLKARKGTKVVRRLFPGYVFARFNPTSMLHQIRFTRGISYVVSFAGAPAIVSDQIISAICQRTDTDGVVIEATEVLNPGDSVVIQSGPLRDFHGVFEGEMSDSDRIRVLLTTVEYSARVEISKYEVRKLHATMSHDLSAQKVV